MSNITEQRYINTTNLAKLRIALSILRDTLFDEGSDINELIRRARMNIAQVADELDYQKECTSCEKEFELEDHNDHAQGYFCDECLDNKGG